MRMREIINAKHNGNDYSGGKTFAFKLNCLLKNVVKAPRSRLLY
jgi:hypothetical protein